MYLWTFIQMLLNRGIMCSRYAHMCSLHTVTPANSRVPGCALVYSSKEVVFFKQISLAECVHTGVPWAQGHTICLLMSMAACHARCLPVRSEHNMCSWVTESIDFTLNFYCFSLRAGPRWYSKKTGLLLLRRHDTSRTLESLYAGNIADGQQSSSPWKRAQTPGKMLSPFASIRELW